jgi:peptidoglycan L-alanyl-D-glutamate endopeptidase CwlK
MRVWGKRSQAAYDTLDPRMQHYCDRALQEVADISLLKGHRGQEEQDAAYYGTPQRSKLPWPKGNHNTLPSLAVDFQPYPKPENELKLWASLAYVAGRIIQMAAEDGVTIRWGGDWDQDGDLTDQNFNDLFHLELREDT